jgi:hypothetical protein
VAALAAFADSRDAMVGVMEQAGPNFGARFKFAIFIGDRAIPLGMDLDEAQEVRNRLLQMPSMPLGMPGMPFPTEDDHYVVDNNNTLIHVAESQVTTGADYLTITEAPVPRTSVELVYKSLRAFASLWQKAK